MPKFEVPLKIHPEVKEALFEGQGVVALESTIISHGMPYPLNVKTARTVEQIIRKQGVIPATVGILDGLIHVGLTDAELEFMGNGKDIEKVSRRDFATIISQKRNGATTVSSTMIAANLAGIHVFTTGGIGGVHRGAQETFDISGDLMELAHTDVAVICAGAKSILDIGLTLEYLETQGVPVIGYRTAEFPAFYTQKSGFEVDYRMDNAEEVADMLFIKWELGLHGGVVIGNPIPSEFAMDEVIITNAISEALHEAERHHISGKKVTPFLLAKIKDITKEESLKSNIHLVYHNAEVGAAIAKAYAERRRSVS
jgi:pseudouridine-5'-phosphate glycosidase